MTKDKMIKLVEGLTSAGYEITKIDRLHNIEHQYYGDIELLLSFTPKVIEPLSKETIIKLIEILHSLEYGILKYELFFNNDCGAYTDVKLELYRLSLQ